MHKIMNSVLRLSLGLAGFLVSINSFAEDPSYTLRAYGAVSDYAFVSMNQPELGLALRVSYPGNWYVSFHSRIAAKNRDPNGGVAGVFSGYAGYTVLRTSILGLPFDSSVYAGYQRLWYGPLYNNGLGGGLKLQTRIAKVTLTGRFGALYGLSGTIGWNLKTAGNDFVFYGRASYPISTNLSVFGFLRQERYVGDGNSLTARDAGLGLMGHFA